MTEPEASLNSELRRALSEEISRIEESAMWSAQGQFEQAKRWRFVNLSLGVPAATLATISGATALAKVTNAVIVGSLALASAALAAALTTINAAQRTNQASAAANAYLEVQTAARQLRLIDLPKATSFDEVRTTLQELTSRRDEINKTAEVISRFAYKRADKNIKAGGQAYSADKGD